VSRAEHLLQIVENDSDIELLLPLCGRRRRPVIFIRIPYVVYGRVVYLSRGITKEGGERGILLDQPE